MTSSDWRQGGLEITTLGEVAGASAGNRSDDSALRVTRAGSPGAAPSRGAAAAFGFLRDLAGDHETLRAAVPCFRPLAALVTLAPRLLGDGHTDYFFA